MLLMCVVLMVWCWWCGVVLVVCVVFQCGCCHIVSFYASNNLAGGGFSPSRSCSR